MSKIFHYTSGKNWVEIQKSGFLFPKSDPNAFQIKTSKRVHKIIKKYRWINSYIVGLERINDKRWAEYGLIEYLMNHVGGDVILEADVVPKNVFVRDHGFVSPKNFKDKYNKDLWDIYYQRLKMSTSDFFNFETEVKNYMESTVLLKDYEGDYSVPEMWIREKIPVGELGFSLAS